MHTVKPEVSFRFIVTLQIKSVIMQWEAQSENVNKEEDISKCKSEKNNPDASHRDAADWSPPPVDTVMVCKG